MTQQQTEQQRYEAGTRRIIAGLTREMESAEPGSQEWQELQREKIAQYEQLQWMRDWYRANPE